MRRKYSKSAVYIILTEKDIVYLISLFVQRSKKATV